MYSVPSDKTENNEHRDRDTASLQCTADNTDYGIDEKSLPAAEPIGLWDTCKRAEKTPDLEQAVHGPNDVWSIGVGIEPEIGIEGWLAQSCGND